MSQSFGGVDEGDTPELAEIVTLALERSRAGELDWEILDDDGLAFTARLASATLVVESVDGDGAAPYRFGIIRSDGREDVLAVVEQESLEDARGGYDHPELERLYKVVRAKVLDVAPVLHSLLAELKSPGLQAGPRAG